MKKILIGGLIALGLVTGAGANDSFLNEDLIKDMEVSLGTGAVNDKGVAILGIASYGTTPIFLRSYKVSGEITTDAQVKGELLVNVDSLHTFGTSNRGGAIWLDAGVGFEIFNKSGNGQSCSGDLISDGNGGMVCTDRLLDNKDEKEFNGYGKFGISGMAHEGEMGMQVSLYGKVGNAANGVGTEIVGYVNSKISLSLNYECKFLNDTDNGKFDSKTNTITAKLNYRF